jgi:hypothetical protein
MAKKKRDLDHVERLIAKNKTKLKLTMTNLAKLEKEAKRLARAKMIVALAAMKPDTTGPVIVQQPPEPKVVAHHSITPPVRDVDLDIPTFLRRSAKDAAVADEIKAEQASVKKAKAAGRIAKMKAKKSGETRKMPLTGKAALDLINNG